MINVALLSRWHVHANDYEKEIRENENFSVQVVWDEEAERGSKWAEELGVRFEQDLQKVLTDSSIDAVVINTPTSMHKEVILAAAKNHKHIFTEKVLAFSLEDCQEIYQTVEEHGVKLVVSLPRLTKDYYLYAQKVVDEGLLGTLTMIRCRLAHNGAVPVNQETSGWLPERFFDKELCGGGSLIDLGAHPIYLTNRLAGPVSALHARLQQTKQLGVDDSAVVLLEYTSGALGVIETSFLSQGSPFQLELYGTHGTLLIEDEEIRLLKDGGVMSIEKLDSLPMPIEQWGALIKTGTPSTITKEDVINLTVINEAAALSHQRKCRVEIKDIVGESDE